MGVDRNKTKIPTSSRSLHFGRKRLREREVHDTACWMVANVLGEKKSRRKGTGTGHTAGWKQKNGTEKSMEFGGGGHNQQIKLNNPDLKVY